MSAQRGTEDTGEKKRTRRKKEEKQPEIESTEGGQRAQGKQQVRGWDAIKLRSFLLLKY
jgi:hypothetical protein